jgi:flagellar hook-basal body complex protein FliE
MDFRIGPIDTYSFIPEVTPPPAVIEKQKISPFSSFFDAAINLFEETNQIQLRAENLQIALATGETDDILSVLQASDRAHQALNFTVQITNRIIESYREIMRMQV